MASASTPTHLVRILIADDHEMIRRGLRDLLERHPDWRICAEASNGRQAVEFACKLLPQVAVLDLTMPEMNGLEATRQIKQALPNTEVLLFTMHENEDLVGDVLGAGALGYLLKSDAARHVMSAIEALCEHKPYFTAKVTRTILEAYLERQRTNAEMALSIDQLTTREREIVQLVAEGHSNKAVSALLGISPKTVDKHRSEIMKKLSIHSITELVRYAVRNKMIEP